MRRFMGFIFGLVLLLSGCSGKMVGTAGTSQAIPACFPFHSPMALGGGPSIYGLSVQGSQPLFLGAAIRLEGEHWPQGGQRVQLFTLRRVENAVPYGQRADLVQCLGAQASPLGQATVQGGHWIWEGRVPSVQKGDHPSLLAVDDMGRYCLQTLDVYYGKALVKPYRLQALPAEAKLAARPEDVPAVQHVVMGEPFHLSGVGLLTADGAVQIHFNYHGWDGNDWMLLATTRAQGGALDATLTIPALADIFGGAHRPVAVPDTYGLTLTNEQRPYAFYHSVSIELLPSREDRALLAAFWRQPQAQSPDLQRFPRTGGVAACTSAAAGGTAVAALCQTQIRRFDLGHDPVGPAPPMAPGSAMATGWHTVVLTEETMAGYAPTQTMRRFVIDGSGQIIVQSDAHP